MYSTAEACRVNTWYSSFKAEIHFSREAERKSYWREAYIHCKIYV